MTIQERLRRSNIIMLVIPILIAGILLILGFGGAIVLLESIYLPRMGLTLHELHNMGEELEPMFQGLKACVLLYAAVVFVALLDSGVYQPIPDPEFICTYPKTVGRFDAGGQADRGRRFGFAHCLRRTG